jgi:NitT/TauT family transport system permease protein
MTFMIVALDQFLWRPVVVWAQKFRLEDAAASQACMTSWFLDVLRRSHVLSAARQLLEAMPALAPRRFTLPSTPSIARRGVGAVRHAALRWLSGAMLTLLGATLLVAALRLLSLVWPVTLREWETTVASALVTLARVLASTALGTLWALPAGLAIGLSPRASRVLQPVVQVVASFPAPMLFPLAIAAFTWAGISLGWGSILLMLLGTQWYILFNVIAGAMAIPADLREAATEYRLRGWRRFVMIYAPGVFPYLVTGWITAAGGAWNASIVAEYVTSHGQELTAPGLGSQISVAARDNDFPLLAASVLVMSALVVIFNRTVWRRCYVLAQQRFSISK